VTVVLQRFTSSKSLTAEEVKSLAPAVADRLAESIVGRARALWEFATGVNPVGDSGATRVNPQGRLGVDRSGPPWGDALTHTLWSIESDAAIDANAWGRQIPWVTLTTQGQIERRVIRLEVKPFDVRPQTPYSRGYARFGGLRIGGAGTAEVECRCYQPDLTGYDEETLTISSSAQTYTTGTPNFPLRPGINTLLVEFELTTTVGMTIDSAAIDQIVRRTH
jgi:hypothetical protein